MPDNDPLEKLNAWEEKATRLRAIASDILDILPDGVVAIDSEGVICLVNVQLEFMFGYLAGELLGQKVEIFLPESLKLKHEGHRESYFDDPKTRSMGAGILLKGRKKKGKEFTVEIMLSPLRTDFGHFAVAVVRKPKERIHGSGESE
jgi:PAS domain S-box-containing protein